MISDTFFLLKQKITPFSKAILYDLLLYAIVHKLYQLLTALF